MEELVKDQLIGDEDNGIEDGNAEIFDADETHSDINVQELNDAVLDHENPEGQDQEQEKFKNFFKPGSQPGFGTRVMNMITSEATCSLQDNAAAIANSVFQQLFPMDMPTLKTGASIFDPDILNGGRPIGVKAGVGTGRRLDFAVDRGDGTKCSKTLKLKLSVGFKASVDIPGGVVGFHSHFTVGFSPTLSLPVTPFVSSFEGSEHKYCGVFGNTR